MSLCICYLKSTKKFFFFLKTEVRSTCMMFDYNHHVSLKEHDIFYTHKSAMSCLSQLDNTYSPHISRKEKDLLISEILKNNISYQLLQKPHHLQLYPPQKKVLHPKNTFACLHAWIHTCLCTHTNFMHTCTCNVCAHAHSLVNQTWIKCKISHCMSCLIKCVLCRCYFTS